MLLQDLKIFIELLIEKMLFVLKQKISTFHIKTPGLPILLETLFLQSQHEQSVVEIGALLYPISALMNAVI